MHTHRPTTRTETAFRGPVSSARPNPAAHGWLTIADICRCGAVRLTNVNQGHAERGKWEENADV